MTCSSTHITRPNLFPLLCCFAAQTRDLVAILYYLCRLQISHACLVDIFAHISCSYLRYITRGESTVPPRRGIRCLLAGRIRGASNNMEETQWNIPASSVSLLGCVRRKPFECTTTSYLPAPGGEMTYTLPPRSTHRSSACVSSPQHKCRIRYDGLLINAKRHAAPKNPTHQRPAVI